MRQSFNITLHQSGVTIPPSYTIMIYPVTPMPGQPDRELRFNRVGLDPTKLVDELLEDIDSLQRSVQEFAVNIKIE